MNENKIDWLIGVVVFVVLAFVFSFQALRPMIETHNSNNEHTSSGTQFAGDDSDVILPSDGDVPVVPEVEESEDVECEDTEDARPELEYMESPKTGDDSVRRTNYCLIYISAFILCHCVIGVIMRVRRIS